MGYRSWEEVYIDELWFMIYNLDQSFEVGTHASDKLGM